MYGNCHMYTYGGPSRNMWPGSSPKSLHVIPSDYSGALNFACFANMRHSANFYESQVSLVRVES